MRQNQQLKLAFIILAHRFPHQLRRLTERLAAPEARIYLNADRGMAAADYRTLRRKLAHRVEVTWLDRIFSRRASFALVKAELAAHAGKSFIHVTNSEKFFARKFDPV